MSGSSAFRFIPGVLRLGASRRPGRWRWGGVDDVAAECRRIHAHVATIHEAPREVGGGITVASALDPFGHSIGLIHKPKFDPMAIS